MSKAPKLLTLTIASAFLLAACGKTEEETKVEATPTPTAQVSEVESPKPTGITHNGAALPESIAAGEYMINTESSTIVWYGKKKIGNDHYGKINLKSGNVKVAENLAFESGEFVIDMASIQDDGSGVGKHLKSEDFFDVEKHPEAKIVIKSVVREGDNSFAITGDITIKGKTSEEKFVADIFQSDTKEGALVAKSTIKLDRTKWDVRFGSDKFFDNLGDNVIEDEFVLTLDLLLEPTK